MSETTIPRRDRPSAVQGSGQATWRTADRGVAPRWGWAGVLALGAATMALALVMALVVAPREVTMGDVQRIFYFHVSASWSGYLALFVAFVASLLYLWRGQKRWDTLALASTEIGLLFITQGIISGSIWARPIWGTWWTWDPRLTTSAVLWLTYAAYFLLRQATEDESRRARLSAVYGIVAFAAIPLNYMAIRWWRGIHPQIVDRSGAGLTPTMLVALLVSLVAFTMLYITLLALRVRLGKAEETVRHLRLR